LALKKGKSFITLAKEKSLSPSGKNGGNLRFFSKSQMVSPFSKAAFSLREGTYTEKPVKTQFGWHIIKVEDSRFAENRSFEEMENEIKRRLLSKMYENIVQSLRVKAKITLGVNTKAKRKNAQ
tara:strand:+ start:4564 stop:4932 length:369 start_codon:yes stop_codon:yes gene_type:complete